MSKEQTNKLTNKQSEEVRTEMSSANDTISRQAALTVLASIAGVGNRALDKIRALPSAQPETHGKRTETHACDLISRQQAISRAVELRMFDRPVKMVAVSELEALPSAQPDITLESAIDYLHSIGWMQEHDRTLTESAQPEIIRCKDCKFFVSDMEWCEADDEHPASPDAFCSWAERRTDE